MDLCDAWPWSQAPGLQWKPGDARVKVNLGMLSHGGYGGVIAELTVPLEWPLGRARVRVTAGRPNTSTTPVSSTQVMPRLCPRRL